MTQERQAQRNYFRLNQGLHTESNELNWPEGYTTYERNYELLRDGSRRRRKGLNKESGGGDDLTVSFISGLERVQTYIWRNVAGDPDKDFYVLRAGDFLYFGDAAETIGGTWLSGASSAVYLPTFYVDNATDEQTRDAPITFSQGRGRLLISGQYIYPFYVEYDVGQIKSTRIVVKIRDFTTIDDGTSIDNQPTTLTDDHYYNLMNRGWSNTVLDLFEGDKSKYPARNAVWHKGYRRTSDTTAGAGAVNPLDGQKEWNSDKLDNEAFGQSSAPVGSLFLDPTNTAGGTTSGDTGSAVNIDTWTLTTSPGFTQTWDISITTEAAHGYSEGEQFSIVNNRFSYYNRVRYQTQKDAYEEDEFHLLVDSSLNGTWTATAGSAGTTLNFRFRESHNGKFDGFEDQYIAKGQAGVPGSSSSTVLVRSTGADHNDSWQAISWFAGRSWYAGMLNEEFNDYIFFSQVVDGPEKYGKCYQEADPTDENYNALTSTDGGHVIIPGMGGVIGMEPLRNALIVFGRDGVWAVETGQGGFTPSSFRVRKLSESGASSIDGVLRVEDTMLYTGPGGIYIIAPNQYTGLLEVQNIVRQTLQSYWTAIPTEQQERIQTVFDDAQRRVYFLYGATRNFHGMTKMLIFDIDSSAWFTYEFVQSGTNTLLTGGSIPKADDPNNGKKMKFIYTTSQTTVNVADFAQDDFIDFTGNESQVPILYTGWETLGNAQPRKQAPTITVFSGRTETGYASDGSGGFNAINGGSTYLQGLWDFTSDDPQEATTGKITSAQQVYRFPRHFVPDVSASKDGYKVVITRNKLRGRGRALQLRFEGEEGKDSHILGFTVNYKVTRKK